MTGTIIIILVLVVGIPLGWYTIAPFFRKVKVDEASPLDQRAQTRQPSVADDFEVMKQDAAKMKEFEDAIAKANQMTEEQKKSLMMNDPMPVSTPSPTPQAVPAGPRLIAQGDLVPRAHEVEGKALLIESDGKKILRFEGLETIDGPNLHVFLSSELGVSDAIDLGRRKATEGNVNYELPDGIDTAKYNKVLYWCVPFRVLFSYAELR